MYFDIWGSHSSTDEVSSLLWYYARESLYHSTKCTIPDDTNIRCALIVKSWVWYFKELFICRSFLIQQLIKVNGRVYIPLISNPITITPSAHKNRSYYQFSQSYPKPFCKDHYMVTCSNFVKTLGFSTHSTIKLRWYHNIPIHVQLWGNDSVSLSWFTIWDYHHDTLLGTTYSYTKIFKLRPQRWV
jgi:hypothetical protein